VAFCATSLFAQNAPPLTPGDLRFFRFVLDDLASHDHTDATRKARSAVLQRQFGLDDQEWAVVAQEVGTYTVSLRQLEDASKRQLGNRSHFNLDDARALEALERQKDELVRNSAAQILSKMRPISVARLQAPGKITVIP
jgi:hypothetical protein